MEKSISYADLSKLLEKTLTRFNNWKIEVERNPSPRMVHSLKNIVAVIDSISSISQENIRYSYKRLNRQMAILIHEVADLNDQITLSLEDDDYIDEEEEQVIIGSLMSVIRASTELIRIVQEGFGSGNSRSKPLELPLPPEG